MSTSYSKQESETKLSQLKKLGKKHNVDSHHSLICIQEIEQQIDRYRQEVSDISFEMSAIKESMAVVLELGMHEVYQIYMERLIEVKNRSKALLIQIDEVKQDKKKWIDLALKQKNVANALTDKFKTLNRKLRTRQEDIKAHNSFLLSKY